MNIARMGRWVLLFALALALGTFALLPPPQQAQSEQPQGQANHGQSVAPVIKPSSSAPQTEAGAKGCPGSYHPQLNCNAISANADEDQARNAEKQTWWFRVEVLVTFFTLVVASLAMTFAKKAADHTETGAQQARRTADIAEQTDRPHLLPTEITLGDLGGPDLEGKTDFGFSFTNHGTGPAWIKRYAMAFRSEPEISKAPPPLTFHNENAAVPPKGSWGTPQPMKIEFTEQMRADVLAEKEQLVLFCRLEYIGADGRKHVHQFAQEYLFAAKRFHPIEHPFWEYT